jgi:transcriptional regulator of NAD metabolism
MHPFTVFYIYGDSEGEHSETIWADDENQARKKFNALKPLAIISRVE